MSTSLPPLDALLDWEPKNPHDCTGPEEGCDECVRDLKYGVRLLRAHLRRVSTELQRVQELIGEVDFKATKIPDENGDWIEGYILPTGPWHRLLGATARRYPKDLLEGGEKRTAETADGNSDRDRMGFANPAPPDPLAAITVPCKCAAMHTGPCHSDVLRARLVVELP